MGNENGESKSALDKYVAPGLRAWMVIGLIGSVMLVMIVIVCCFCKIRIPRTKRQIEVIATRRKIRKQQSGGMSGGGLNGLDPYEERRTQAIVMNSLASRPGKSDRMQTTNGNGHRREPLNSHSVNV